MPTANSVEKKINDTREKSVDVNELSTPRDTTVMKNYLNCHCDECNIAKWRFLVDIRAFSDRIDRATMKNIVEKLKKCNRNMVNLPCAILLAHWQVCWMLFRFYWLRSAATISIWTIGMCFGWSMAATIVIIIVACVVKWCDHTTRWRTLNRRCNMQFGYSFDRF